METTPVKTYNVTWIAVFLLVIVIGYIIYLKSKYSALRKAYGLAVRKMDAEKQIDAQEPETAPTQPEILEQPEVEMSEEETEETVVQILNKKEDEQSETIFIPASLRYKVQIESERAFNAISTSKTGGMVHAEIDNDGMMVFSYFDTEGKIGQVETRAWPVPEKEIGTILNRMLNAQKT